MAIYVKSGGIYRPTESTADLPAGTSIAGWVLLSSSGAVCGSPCFINRIRCVSGTSVTLTVYDNAAASSGTGLYTGTLSSGQEASIAAPLQAINGVRAVFASGSFEFEIQQEAV